jgi:NIMA (never in mitosis gene a)-related kinase
MMHRDIKPANVFITGSGVLKLGDMGLGRQLSQESVAAFSKVGTPLYMSPELLKGDGYDMKSDIWSLGCVLYEMANLRSPFKTDDQNLYALFQRITSCDYPPLSDAYSPELSGLVGRMVQIDSTARPDMQECSNVAAANSNKFRSRRSVHIICEEISYMLQLLDYGRRFCAARRRPAFSRQYFAGGAEGIAGEDASLNPQVRTKNVQSVSAHVTCKRLHAHEKPPHI